VQAAGAGIKPTFLEHKVRTKWYFAKYHLRAGETMTIFGYARVSSVGQATLPVQAVKEVLTENDETEDEAGDVDHRGEALNPDCANVR
jgi:hypothetical protein